MEINILQMVNESHPNHTSHSKTLLPSTDLSTKVRCSCGKDFTMTLQSMLVRQLQSKPDATTIPSAGVLERIEEPKVGRFWNWIKKCFKFWG